MESFDYSQLNKEVRGIVEQCTCEIKVCLHQGNLIIIAIGIRLLEVKEHLDHGMFGKWLSKEFCWSQDTANRYMKVGLYFKKYLKCMEEIPQNAEFQKRALYYLSKPSVSEQARKKAVELFVQGGIVTFAKAKELNSLYNNCGEVGDASSQVKQTNLNDVASLTKDEFLNTGETEVLKKQNHTFETDLTRNAALPEDYPIVGKDTLSNEEQPQQKVEEKLAINATSRSEVSKIDQLEIVSDTTEEQKESSRGFINVAQPEKTTEIDVSPTILEEKLKDQLSKTAKEHALPSQNGKLEEQYTRKIVDDSQLVTDKPPQVDTERHIKNSNEQPENMTADVIDRLSKEHSEVIFGLKPDANANSEKVLDDFHILSIDEENYQQVEEEHQIFDVTFLNVVVVIEGSPSEFIALLKRVQSTPKGAS